MSARRRHPGGILAVILGLTAVLALGLREDAEPTGTRVANPVWSEGRVRVQVLNGGGVTGMARAATGVVRGGGFDVVEFGNAYPFDPERPSVVIDRVGRTDIARAVAATLGIDNVQSDPDPNLYVDVSVVVGQDWDEPEEGTAVEAAPARPIWDPRGWFGS